ncbi:hypothetical protein KABACHOK_04740 [Brevundimonas phage vB_BpoS-Kabachok]|uniref:Uncharacterized protein n=1 Tax=Brevundimonas phage vB_BpoS-Kabachok TaxID=2948600 RepID=A0A9E7MR30_9CAUD|nr:hypothetical protein KABACHOK_04740 [Brevundimonas phage vB_BpoS-Kabachok]
MSNRALWLVTSLIALASSLFVIFGSMTPPSSMGVELGAALSLCLSLLAFLRWLDLGDQESRRRAQRRHNIQPR